VLDGGGGTYCGGAAHQHGGTAARSGLSKPPGSSAARRKVILVAVRCSQSALGRTRTGVEEWFPSAPFNSAAKTPSCISM
jgi:hypothetical protein